MSNGSIPRFDPGDGTFPKAPAETGISGRRFVIGSLGAVFFVATGVYGIFLSWRASYESRLKFGHQHVVKTIEPLLKVAPDDPNVDPIAWKAAIDQTQAMLEALVASNLLDRPALAELGSEIRGKVAKARPENVRQLLSKLWDEVAEKAGPSVVKRHPKPNLLQRRPKSGSLAS